MSLHHQMELATSIRINLAVRTFTKVRLFIERLKVFIVCEEDSSKMRESSAEVVDGDLDENFYVLTISSKAHPNERSSSRGKLHGGGGTFGLPPS